MANKPDIITALRRDAQHNPLKREPQTYSTILSGTLAGLGETVNGFSRALGIDEHTGRRWCSGTLGAPEPIERVMMFFHANPAVWADFKGYVAGLIQPKESPTT